MKKYIVKTRDLKKLIELEEEFSSEDILEITVSKLSVKNTSSKVIKLLEDRIKNAGADTGFEEAVFDSDIFDGKDLEEVRQYFEEKGYGVKIERIGDNIKILILWKYA